MLNNLKKTIINRKFIHFTNVEIKYDELVVSADVFTGYDCILELAEISQMIDTDIYSVKYLNGDVIKIKMI